jgi:DNA-binding NarL/FixJ family response regulator
MGKSINVIARELQATEATVYASQIASALRAAQ